MRCVLVVVLALVVSVRAGPCEDCFKTQGKGWCVSSKSCVDLKELSPKAQGSCPPSMGVFVADNCPRDESTVKCDAATVKKVMDDILKGVAEDTAKIEAGDKVEAERIAKEILKTVSLFYDVSKSSTKAVATDLYYCTFGPYAPEGVKATAEQARTVVQKLFKAIFSKFSSEIAVARREATEASNPPKVFMELQQRLLHKKNLREHQNPLALIESKEKLRAFDWFANLWNWGASVTGWVPYWQSYMQPAHCLNVGAAGLFEDCNEDTHRAWANNPNNCGVPMSADIKAKPKASQCDWWSGAEVCPLAAAAAPAAPAPAILGPSNAIDGAPGNCGAPQRNAAGKKLGHINDCRAQGFNKLHLWGPNYSPCVNLQWSYCGAAGKLPNQGGVGKVRVLVPPRQWQIQVAGLHPTQEEMCVLHFMCRNNAQLWQAPGDFVFTCQQ